MALPHDRVYTEGLSVIDGRGDTLQEFGTACPEGVSSQIKRTGRGDDRGLTLCQESGD